MASSATDGMIAYYERKYHPQRDPNTYFLFNNWNKESVIEKLIMSNLVIITVDHFANAIFIEVEY